MDVQAVARAEVETIALEEARRAIAGQEQALAELRARTNMLIGAASVVVSFLGAQALHAGGWSVTAALAVLAFVATMALATSILWPMGDAWRFRTDPRVLLQDFADADQAPSISVRRHLAESLARAAESNTARLAMLYQRLRWALVALVVQVVLWVVQLANST